MTSELTTLPLMYSVTVTANGRVLAESNDSIISTLCAKMHWHWPYESVECSLQLQLDGVNIVKLAPLKHDFSISNVRIFKYLTQSLQFQLNRFERCRSSICRKMNEAGMLHTQQCRKVYKQFEQSVMPSSKNSPFLY